VYPKLPKNIDNLKKIKEKYFKFGIMTKHNQVIKVIKLYVNNIDKTRTYFGPREETMDGAIKLNNA
jgi:hypothetical protein